MHFFLVQTLHVSTVKKPCQKYTLLQILLFLNKMQTLLFYMLIKDASTLIPSLLQIVHGVGSNDKGEPTVSYK